MKIRCIGCALQKGELKRFVEMVYETKNFNVEQDFETPIPGFMIISSKKHIKSIEELNENQRKEFIEVLYKVRKALTKILKVKYVYIIQKEDTIIARSHFHMWLFPRYKWMNRFGDKITSVTSIIEYSRKKMQNILNLRKTEKAAQDIKKYLE